MTLFICIQLFEVKERHKGHKLSPVFYAQVGVSEPGLKLEWNGLASL